ncbi:septum formation initiator family protein [Quadrisphaera sp. DSM 44207]|uniref:FtsB family cell division protein n=1 Tax=Quadrisphaera sp. DSM 44207 TaxID=1881057 RepID=UPI00088C4929|nr:septum formation initiator family protein [Quadrisphaera sp. DSM 44207]SDQ68750.1 Cell division protein FtsB [Quadrisphaera sp. DSM 44207]
MPARRPPAPRPAQSAAGRGGAGRAGGADRAEPAREPRAARAAGTADSAGAAGAAGAARAGRAWEGLQARLPWLRRLRGMTVGAGLVLASVLFGLVSVVPPLRSWVAQQAELGELREDVAARQVRVQQLQAEVDRWDDPAYVSAQARARLHYVLPGERAYVVVDPPTGAVPEDSAPPPAEEDESWLQELWRAVRGDSGTLEDGVLEGAP